jgi:hypothetical protein
MISLSVVVRVAYVFRAGLMIWMVVVDRDRDRGGGRDGSNGNNEQQEWFEKQ